MHDMTKFFCPEIHWHLLKFLDNHWIINQLSPNYLNTFYPYCNKQDHKLFNNTSFSLLVFISSFQFTPFYGKTNVPLNPAKFLISTQSAGSNLQVHAIPNSQPHSRGSHLNLPWHPCSCPIPMKCWCLMTLCRWAGLALTRTERSVLPPPLGIRAQRRPCGETGGARAGKKVDFEVFKRVPSSFLR